MKRKILLTILLALTLSSCDNENINIIPRFRQAQERPVKEKDKKSKVDVFKVNDVKMKLPLTVQYLMDKGYTPIYNLWAESDNTQLYTDQLTGVVFHNEQGQEISTYIKGEKLYDPIETARIKSVIIKRDDENTKLQMANKIKWKDSMDEVIEKLNYENVTYTKETEERLVVLVNETKIIMLFSDGLYSIEFSVI